MLHTMWWKTFARERTRLKLLLVAVLFDEVFLYKMVDAIAVTNTTRCGQLKAGQPFELKGATSTWLALGPT